MRRSRNRGRRAAILTLVAAVVTSTLAAAPVDSSTTDRPVNADIFLTGADAKDFRLTGQRRVPSGSYKTSWTDGSTTIEATTGKAAKVRVTQQPGALRVDVTPGPDEREARDLAADPEPGDILGEPICVSIGGGDEAVESFGCATRKFDQDTATKRYVVDEMQQSAVAHDDSAWFNNSLTRVDTLVTYEEDQRVIKFEPGKDVEIGGCQTLNVGITGDSGLEFGWSKEICGDGHGPYHLPQSDGPEDQSFGHGWWGNSAEGKYVEAVGVTQVEMPTVTSGKRTLTFELNWQWNWCPGVC